MATALAHEIKNPTALAMAYAGIIRQSTDCSETRAYCNLIQDALLDISDLVQELLFSIHRKPTVESFHLGTLIGDMVAEHRAAHPHITFVENLPPQLMCDTNEQCLRLVISNLLKNAVEAATHCGHVGHVAMTVTDSNGGLKIKVANSCVPGSEAKPYGTGMGIGIATWLLDQLGGTLTLSEVGEDFVAIVSLPTGASSS